MALPSIAIVWLKRDLRLLDHEPMVRAQQTGLPVLLLYCFEPSVMAYPDSDVRHWRFVYESIEDMQLRLRAHNARVYTFQSEIAPVLDCLREKYTIQSVFSHQETGNKVTYDRDMAMQVYFQQHGIAWQECRTNGIIRRLKSRANWDQRWEATMVRPPIHPELNNIPFLALPEPWYQTIKGPEPNAAIQTRQPTFQPGGEQYAWRYLHSFLQDRHVQYSRHISKPEASRTGCSRLSPYLAYGNISIRMVYQATLRAMSSAKNKSALRNFISRLHWHCHFIQKFEDECRMEFENVNKGYDELPKTPNAAFIKAWQEGHTGVPLVDACMRCVVQTGYLNFRMRAMVVSFFVHNLWQDWRDLHFLARQFLDYEPGIHYPQIQMQSGLTGVNTIRIYNPVKNALEHDAEGVFVKKWVPELRNIPAPLVHEPWKLNEMEQVFYNCRLGQDYPWPIVDLESSRQHATDVMWSFRKKDIVRQEGERILKKHVRPGKRS